MNIYELSRDTEDWDCFIAHVVVAHSRREAKELADSGREPCSPSWGSAKITKVGIYTGRRKTPFVVLSDFRAA